MKKTICSVACALVAALPAAAQKTNWAADKAHSKIQFTIAHMVVSEVTGQFHDYTGTIRADKDDFSDISIDLSIDVKSIDTDNEKRDGHLKSSDFFDAAKYPVITFKSGSMTKTSGNLYKLTGDLTMHGVTKTITLDVKYGGTITDPYKNIRAGFKVTGVIKRSDFGLEYNSVMETGGLMLGDEIAVSCNAELIKQQ